MRLFRRKRNNKGFSLVEVICAVAILGLTSTAIGSTMIVSTQNYQRGNAEVDVQKEAQTTTNLIGNLIVDAADVDPEFYTGTTTIRKMTIKGENKEYVIAYDNTNGTITYKEKVSGGTESSGTLATDVTDFRGDFTNYVKNKNVALELAVSKNDRNYAATYATTSRNRKAVKLGARASAFISCESIVILEPGQQYYLPITVHGMDANDAGIVWSGITAFDGNSAVGTSSLANTSPQGANIKIGKEAKGTLTFTIATKKDPDTNLPLDTKTVTVKVRRVTGIEVVGSRKSGVPCMQDAVYHVDATAMGTSFDKAIGKAYDDGTAYGGIYEYKNPRYIDFAFSMSNGANASDYVQVLSNEGVENTDNPFIEFKLKQSIPASTKLIVTAISKHAQGKIGADSYNKTGEAYATVTKDYEIINSGGVISLTNGLERGNDYLGFTTTLDLQGLKSKHGGEITWLFRYKAEDGSWSQYYRTKESGSAQKINAVETYLFDVNKAYDYELMFALVDWGNKKLMWPHDPALLQSGKGFTEYGITKGWNENDPNKYEPQTENPAEYSQVFQLGRTEICFTGYGSFVTGGDMNNLPAGQGEFVGTAGTQGDPIKLVRNQSTNGKFEINFDYANLDKGKYTPSASVQKFEGGKWVDISANGKFGLQVGGGEGGKVTVENIDQNNVPVGSYRLKMKFNNQKNAGVGGGSNIYQLNIAENNNGNWDLSGTKLVKQDNGSETSMEYGYIYFNIANS